MSFEEEILSHNGELIQLQQLCHSFGIKYTMDIAIELLTKFNVNVTKDHILELYYSNKLTTIKFKN